MSGYETKVALMAVLRYSQETSDPRKTEKFIEDLLIADGYIPEKKEKDDSK